MMKALQHVLKRLYSLDQNMMLGIVFLCLAVGSLIFVFLFWRGNQLIEIHGVPIVPPPLLSETINSASKNIFERLQFQKVHQDYQKAYLQLTEKIYALNPKGFDVNEQKGVFTEYTRAYKKYQETVKKIAENEKDQKLRCFSIMKSTILAIMYYDKKSNKKMFRFDPEKMIESGALKEILKCPGGGEFSIIYRDGRRFFRCSIHGTLKQN